MGDASTVASNTEAGKAAGRISARINGALEGLPNAFRTAMENLDSECVEAKLNKAFSEYYLNHKKAVETVQKNGVTISENVVAAAARVEGTDVEVKGKYSSAFPYLNPLLVPAPENLPVGVLAPEYYDRNILLREINNKP
ncbi:hypothetical protein [Nocardiopsis ganjiahuensis]|uniref:hypothetical protein n=1 Tax=Nocardiopsis ganjiahuensis TaxID=239984 RepID=UPI00034C9DEC|nr:hypothetical protein [Nocardiopsis ganjiahuensis]